MARTPSTMLSLGTEAPDFKLPDTNGNQITLQQFSKHKGLLVIFMCNHCPFVIHLGEVLAAVTKKLQEQGIAVVAINANDVENFPDDSPEKMADEVTLRHYTFPYLYDESQSVAKAYQAACTPDFYLFDNNFKLVYRGQFDASRPGNDIQVTGNDIITAANHLLENKPPVNDQKPSIGCNIKWKSGNEPEYYNQ